MIIIIIIIIAYRSEPAFYGTGRFITVFTRALPTGPYPPVSLRCILILSTHLRLGLPSGPFPSGFPTNGNDKPIKSLLKGKGLLPPVGLARLDS
jgi:hypothetical protein